MHFGVWIAVVIYAWGYLLELQGAAINRSQVIRLVLEGPKSSIRSGDRVSYQALTFMEHLQSLQNAEGFTVNGLIFGFGLLQSKGTESSRACPRERPLVGGEEGTAPPQSRGGLAPAPHCPSPHNPQCLH